MEKYEPLLDHIQITNKSFEILRMFDENILIEDKQSLQFSKFVIKDNKVYYDNYDNGYDAYSKGFAEYLSKIAENNLFKDTAFYVFCNEGIDIADISWYRDDPDILNYVENLPAFMFNRDT